MITITVTDDTGIMLHGINGEHTLSVVMLYGIDG
jgi:hypothetical protein